LGDGLAPAIRATGLEGLRFHDLRHTCVALLISQGAHPKAVQEHVGHSSITVTYDRYGHLFPAIAEQLAEGLDATYERRQRSLPPTARTSANSLGRRWMWPVCGLPGARRNVASP
jgi:hypothetical protein